MVKLIALVDRFIFIKKGYAFLAHLVPFAVAALLLLILSVPEDNLLRRISDLLKSSQPGRVPILILTLIGSLVYFFSILALIRKAYLWKRGLWVRTIGTSLVYLLASSFLAFGVFRTIEPGPLEWRDYWTCYLIAVLSLVGIGWDLPTGWVDKLGVKIPDYSTSHQQVDNIGRVLREVRNKVHGAYEDLEAFTSALKALKADVDDNILLEPVWMRESVRITSGRIAALIAATEERFPKGDATAVENFSQACRCKNTSTYQSFVAALRALSLDWPSLNCPENGES